ncbi:hypothetical protein ACFQPF_16020 [Fictibacillus iocasae]|uniref:Uncharacterized protein n=1 Tax=Fictibacillus iocasae TaxID=2715437 RepID=A0ABW2NW27_9BACL
MNKRTPEEIAQWMEDHLPDFKNFTPYLFKQAWIHLFCESSSGEDCEIKMNGNTEQIFWRALNNLDREEEWYTIDSLPSLMR